MAPDVIALSSDPELSAKLKSIFVSLGLSAKFGSSLDLKPSNNPRNFSPLILIDLDSLKPEEYRLRKLRSLFHSSNIVGISSLNWHPELKDAIRGGVFTALIKHPFEDELIYWIKSLSATASPKSEQDVGSDLQYTEIA